MKLNIKDYIKHIFCKHNPVLTNIKIISLGSDGYTYVCTKCGASCKPPYERV